jgi:hypothetical protein
MVLTGLVPGGAAAPPDGDLAFLRVLVGVELLAADYQERARRGGRLGPASAAVLRQLGADDAAHYTGLAALLTRAGVTPATARDIDFSYPARSFASEHAALALGAQLATLALGAYLGAVAQVETPQLRLPIGQIAANEAQHVSALAQLLGRPLVGRAFAPALPIGAVSTQLDRYES